MPPASTPRSAWGPAAIFNTASYATLKSAYPILTADGREAVLSGLPNTSNIGAGTVFANYGGEPLPATSLDESPGNAKGGAVVYGAFVCINCRVMNRYGRPEGEPSPFDLRRRQDLTLLGWRAPDVLHARAMTGRLTTAAGPAAQRPLGHG